MALVMLLGYPRLDRLRARWLGRRLSPEKRFTAAEVESALRRLARVARLAA